MNFDDAYTIFGFYCLFAITTAIYAIMELLLPVLRKFSKNKPKEAESPNTLLLVIIFSCISLLMAPYIFICCVTPHKTDAFREGLYKGLFNLK